MSKSEIYKQEKGEGPSRDIPITSWFEDDWFVCQIIKIGLDGLTQTEAVSTGFINYLNNGAADIDGKKIAALVRKANDRKIRFNDRS